MAAEDHPVLLYDGVCALCNGTVKWLLARDRAAVLRFAALQGEFAAGVLQRHPALQGVDSLIFVEPDAVSGTERVSVRSDAVLRVVDRLGGAWRVLQCLRIIPRAIRDWCYDLIARNRYQRFGRYDTCPVPREEDRARFLS